MIDGSKTRKSLAGVEVQSPYVVERRSKLSSRSVLIIIRIKEISLRLELQSRKNIRRSSG